MYHHQCLSRSTKFPNYVQHRKILTFFSKNRSTQSAVHSDTPNAKKRFYVTSTPLTKSKKNEEFLAFVQKFPLDYSKQVLHSKSSAKLIKLFGKKEFVK